MNPDFKATCAHVEDMGDHLSVGLADKQHGTVDFLTFQRAYEFDDEDVRLGMDAVYVERNDQGFSGYGGMCSVVLYPNRLHIDFDDRGTAFMGGITATDVAFEFSSERFEALRLGLLRCFSGFSYFHDKTRNT
jgi:hypothetical protein